MILDFKHTVVVEYNMNQEKHIEYLYDYSKFLNKHQLYDPKILQWQVENSSLLKPMGVDVGKIKMVIFNYSEIWWYEKI